MDTVCRECRFNMVTFAEDVCKMCRAAIAREREHLRGMCTVCQARRPWFGRVCMTCRVDHSMSNPGNRKKTVRK